MLEQKNAIENDILDQILHVLKIPLEGFQNFDEEHAVNIISNTFGEHASLIHLIMEQLIFIRLKK